MVDKITTVAIKKKTPLQKINKKQTILQLLCVCLATDTFVFWTPKKNSDCR